MALSLRTPTVVCKEVIGTTFSFYSPEQVKKFSVKRISNPLMFDPLNNAVPEGLYDPALGPTENHQSCQTCRLGYAHCPGHFGHVELCVPVYNPLVFPTVVKLMRATCFHCHRIKMDSERVKRFAKKFRLLSQGLVPKAMAVSTAPRLKEKKDAKGLSELDEWLHSNKDEVDDVVSTAPPSGAVTEVPGQVLMLQQELIQEVMSAMPGKCENCSANNPKIKHENDGQVFWLPLSSKQRNANMTLGVDPEANLMSSEAEEWATVQRLASDGAAATPTKKKSKPLDPRDGIKYLTAAQVKKHLMLVNANEKDFMNLMFRWEVDGPAAHQGASADPSVLFIEALPVTPNKFRPASKVGDMVSEHPQNSALVSILNTNIALVELSKKHLANPTEAFPVDAAARTWLTLQRAVTMLLDSSKARKGEATNTGIRQQLEKKEGLFRKNMMGKRVNFAARSVISPDPLIATDEIGVPPYFATRLTFPELVTPMNVNYLRDLVVNGPKEHPGANAVEDERGNLMMLDRMNEHRRKALSKTLLSMSASSDATGPGGKPETKAKYVYRHLRDGDVLLVNRQPTLHKPGIMAHKVRVLQGQRTIRMHYANCSTYNADFDGDEMNLHFPQDQFGRAEAEAIVAANEQFTVPTDGKPLRGLIQDHIVGAVLLTKRDTFLDRATFCQLLYSSCGAQFLGKRRNAGGLTMTPEEHIAVPPPAVLKPKPLWTGKQVIGAILDHLTRGEAPVYLRAGSKTPADYWGKNSGEEVFRIFGNDLVHGVLDKAQFGSYGLVHAVQETLGNKAAGWLLSAFSRVFTSWLQIHGFTCGMEDIVLNPHANAVRKEKLSGSEQTARAIAATFAQVEVPTNAFDPANDFRTELGTKLRNKPTSGAELDMRSSGALSKVTSAAIKACLPSGNIKPFPSNCMTAMTMTGAKGSMVNASQIAALLGQQELEGRRVPRMVSGKTLPCFSEFDTGARSCGYIADRFLTGLRPQEYFFHCMSGREGLVDTAVKTSRSGYLQRCLVKSLESLRVCYDYTVRDSDGSIVQFYYGDDALDVTKTSYLSKYEFTAENADTLNKQVQMERMKAVLDSTHADAAWTELASYDKQPKGERPMPVLAQLPPGCNLGSVSEKFHDAVEKYVKANGDGLLVKKQKAVDRRLKGRCKPGTTAQPMMTKEAFTDLMNLRYMRCLVAPGEAVGVVAAQSVGEPSTQMTLNTFHFAGRGEANVTLGIPRLRELLMTASKKIATPVMTLPILPEAVARKGAAIVSSHLNRVRLAEVIRSVEVVERPLGPHPRQRGRARAYSISVAFRGPVEESAEDICGEGFDGPAPTAQRTEARGDVTFVEFVRSMRERFILRLHKEVRMQLKKAVMVSGTGGIIDEAAAAAAAAAAASAKGGGEEEGDDGDREGERAGGEGKAQGEDQGDVFEDSEEEDDEEEEGAKTERRQGDRAMANEEQEDLDGEGSGGDEDGSDSDEEDHVGTPARAKEKKALAVAFGESDTDVDSDDDDAKGRSERTKGESAVGSKQKKKNKAAEKKTRKSVTVNEPPTSAQQRAAMAKGFLIEPVPELQETMTVDFASGTVTVSLHLEAKAPKLLMLELAERAAAATTIRETEGVSKTYIVEEDQGGDGGPAVQTDGINFNAAWTFSDCVDVNRIRTNHVAAMLETYGIEAARAALMQEVSGVFGVYGIGVDSRHLSLITDFMTFQGEYRACNRIGISAATSPFLKMSFETATQFLTGATLQGNTDTMASPSARIVLGRVVEMGTGAISLMQNFPACEPVPMKSTVVAAAT